MPSQYQTGTPRHFHSSTTPGTASLMSARMRPSIAPRQSPKSSIRLSMSAEGDAFFAGTLFFRILGLFIPAGFGLFADVLVLARIGMRLVWHDTLTKPDGRITG